MTSDELHTEPILARGQARALQTNMRLVQETATSTSPHRLPSVVVGKFECKKSDCTTYLPGYQEL